VPKLEKDSYYYCYGFPPVGYEDSLQLPLSWNKPKMPGRRDVAIARAEANDMDLDGLYSPSSHATKVGHRAYMQRPKRWRVQLEVDDLYMIVIPQEFMTYVSGRAYPQLVAIHYRAGCIWILHAHPFNKDTHISSRSRRVKSRDNPIQPVVLDNGWYGLADFYGLKVGDYVMFKVIPNGFKMTMYDRITSCEREVSYNDHP
jgi:hypothetical protein